MGTDIVLSGAAAWVLAKVSEPTLEAWGNTIKKGLHDRPVEFFVEVCQGGKDTLERQGRDGQEPHPRVINSIARQTDFYDEELFREYFAGLLASGFSEEGRDDRAAVHAKKVGTMSNYEIQFHYFFYRTLHEKLQDRRDLPLGNLSILKEITLIFPFTELGLSMGLTDEEMQNGEALITSTMAGLANQGLIQGEWLVERPEMMRAFVENYTPVGLAVAASPSYLGMDLFSQAHGRNDVGPSDFLTARFENPALEELHTPEKCQVRERSHIIDAGTYRPEPLVNIDP